ncbi:hypothetical protein CcCBS67573_g10709, partial [Chytriomyces confervae]
DEQARRREVETTNVYIRVYYNDKEITRTVPQPIDMERFTVVFKGIETCAVEETEADTVRQEDANVFGVRVREIPQSIKIEFYETGIFGNQFIGEAFVPIPDAGNTVRSRDREMKSFAFGGRSFFQKYTTSLAMRFTHKWIEGSIKMNVAWGVNDEGKSLGPPVKQLSFTPILKALLHIYINIDLHSFQDTSYRELSRYTDPLSVTGPSGLLNLRKLMDWIMDVKLDPNDPRNVDVLRLKKLVQMGGHEGLSFHEYWSERKYFRLDVPRKMKELAQGVGLDANLDSKRLTLMKKRFRKEGIVKGPIPFDDKDITDDLYEKVANPLEDDVIALALWKPKSAQDTKSIHDTNTNLGFLKRIRMHQLIQRARQGRAPRVQDFVREERVVEVEATESFLLSFFLPKRPLKPNRISRFARVTSQPEDGCKISVKVLQGFNVPVRKVDHMKMTDEQLPTVRSYVEVSFQGRKARTSVFEGSNPHWNETLSLDVKPPNNDFKPESILDSEVGMERIYFQLFDELLVDIIEDDRDREYEIHQRRERNWIGTFSMPFTALYEQTRVC